MTSMKHYLVSYRVKYAGQYVPEDGCTSNGGYHEDLHGWTIVYAASKAQARRLVDAAVQIQYDYHTASVTKVDPLKEGAP